MAAGGGRDFFISYTGVNEPWARWIAVELERAGYTTVSQALDFRPGQDFVHGTQQAVFAATRTIVVMSPAYEGSVFGEAGWRPVFADDPSGEAARLVPVRVQPCQPQGLLRTRIYIDLVDLDEPTAREKLLTGVGPASPRPTTAPFPGGTIEPRATHGLEGVPFPGAGPQVSNLGASSRSFTGRDDALEALHARLQDSAVSAVVNVEAVHGLGGVGKTELAREYAHRFASDYDLIWWIGADQPTATASALVALAGRLGVPEHGDQTETITGLFELLRHRSRWLLVYDNAEQPRDLDGLLPPVGAGHVVVTSRWQAWTRHANPVHLEVFDRTESVHYLRTEIGQAAAPADTGVLHALADLLGDLPLALAEAAAYIEQTHLSPEAYLELVRERARELFATTDPGGVLDDERRVATVWSLTLERIRIETPAAETLLGLFAYLAPDDIPRILAPAHPETLEELPQDVATIVADPLRYNNALAALARYSIITLGPDTISVHRLVQTITRARLSANTSMRLVEAAVRLVRAAFPRVSQGPMVWPECARLMRHLLVVAEHAEHNSVGFTAVGWSLNEGARFLSERGQYSQACSLTERALAAYISGLGSDHPHIGVLRSNLGARLYSLGKHHAARHELEESLRIGLAALDSDHPDIGVRRSNLGVVLKCLGQLDAARHEHEESLRIGLAALGPDHPSIGIRRDNLGNVLHALGRLNAARHEHEQALRISQASLAPDHPSIGIQRANLGTVLRDLGELGAARHELEEALRSGLTILGPEHPKIGTLRGNLGSVLRLLGQLHPARHEHEEALRISLATLGPDHPDVSLRRSNLAVVLHDLGDLDAARDECRAALSIARDAFGPDHPRTEQAYEALSEMG